MYVHHAGSYFRHRALPSALANDPAEDSDDIVGTLNGNLVADILNKPELCMLVAQHALGVLHEFVRVYDGIHLPEHEPHLLEMTVSAFHILPENAPALLLVVDGRKPYRRNEGRDEPLVMPYLPLENFFSWTVAFGETDTIESCAFLRRVGSWLDGAGLGATSQTRRDEPLDKELGENAGSRVHKAGHPTDAFGANQSSGSNKD